LYDISDSKYNMIAMGPDWLTAPSFSKLFKDNKFHFIPSCILAIYMAEGDFNGRSVCLLLSAQTMFVASGSAKQSPGTEREQMLHLAWELIVRDILLHEAHWSSRDLMTD
jgi:hypothetical protein